MRNIVITQHGMNTIAIHDIAFTEKPSVQLFPHQLVSFRILPSRAWQDLIAECLSDNNHLSAYLITSGLPAGSKQIIAYGWQYILC